MKTTTFTIEGMHCDGCAENVESLVRKQPGVRMVSVSFAERQARVLYDPQAVGEEQLVAIIRSRAFGLWVVPERRPDVCSNGREWFSTLERGGVG